LYEKSRILSFRSALCGRKQSLDFTPTLSHVDLDFLMRLTEAVRAPQKRSGLLSPSWT
jgi:hypothetical protein